MEGRGQDSGDGGDEGGVRVVAAAITMAVAATRGQIII